MTHGRCAAFVLALAVALLEVSPNCGEPAPAPAFPAGWFGLSGSVREGQKLAEYDVFTDRQVSIAARRAVPSSPRSLPLKALVQ
jgi:hypothetical protein